MWPSDWVRRQSAAGNYRRMSAQAMLVGVLASACGDLPLEASARRALDDGGAGAFSETFDALDPALWSCEGRCPDIEDGKAAFSLLPDVPPSSDGSWSKIRYTQRRFTEGAFSVRFALGPRPEERVFWGVALYDDGPLADHSQYNEINFGYTTDGSLGNTQLLLTSARLGNKVSLEVDTGADLYDGSFHTGKLVYDAGRVELYFDGELVETITDRSVIPTSALDLILGTRLVSEPVLGARFEHIVDRCDVEW